jgi:hypothetical protein
MKVKFLVDYDVLNGKKAIAKSFKKDREYELADDAARRWIIRHKAIAVNGETVQPPKPLHDLPPHSLPRNAPTDPLDLTSDSPSDLSSESSSDLPDNAEAKHDGRLKSASKTSDVKGKR